MCCVLMCFITWLQLLCFDLKLVCSCCNLLQLRTDELLDGFKKELGQRSDSLNTSRTELETLFAKRVDDAAVDLPENADWKSKVLVALRTCESAFTSYTGSVRSIKAVVDTCTDSCFFFHRWDRTVFCLDHQFKIWMLIQKKQQINFVVSSIPAQSNPPGSDPRNLQRPNRPSLSLRRVRRSELEMVNMTTLWG